MDSKLLETVLKAAYDSGFKDGSEKINKTTVNSKNIEASKTKPSLQKEWLRPIDLKNEFGIAEKTQAKYRSERSIPYTKISAFIYYERIRINQWLENHTVV